MADSWPLHNYLELGALPGAVPCARLHARQLLWEWGLSDVIYDVELLVSELVTNALRASAVMKQALPIRLWLLSNNVRVVVSVWDGNPRPPVRMNVGDDAESGRGLILVEALSDRWDWLAHKGLGGKVVWCEISRETVTAAPGRNPRTGH
jgi:anti-sigma regulatory factor (Ser/Thr protein kinase)